MKVVISTAQIAVYPKVVIGILADVESLSDTPIADLLARCCTTGRRQDAN
jgi:hypothetical protein